MQTSIIRLDSTIATTKVNIDIMLSEVQSALKFKCNKIVDAFCFYLDVSYKVYFVTISDEVLTDADIAFLMNYTDWDIRIIYSGGNIHAYRKQLVRC